ncbi:hypothetical protein EV363DRAFT_1397708 [Boletus edulis]|nr:hypothetical protein EV363DRAFT_1397708 [Boletus edulis]
MRYGCIGASPVRPSVAVTVRTLELYRQMHRACPRFSIHAMAKALCHLHGVRFHRYLVDQFRVAFDNSCPACHYKLQDEPPLPFAFQLSMDGNNSAKCVDPSFRHGIERDDPRDGRSSIWIKEEDVDRFKDEVRNIQLSSDKRAVNVVDPDDPWVDEPDNDAEPTNVCIDRWRNAAPEARKRMFAVFRRSGIFVSVCRHGLLLTICDMVRSGELMKYPLATISRLMDLFPDNFLYGYDIHCAFTKTLNRSTLGPAVRARRIDGVVPSFHGHAHNRMCQVQHHPKYKHGAGKEDFETCERTFSDSNALASEIRNATDFHRHQALEEHFKFADLDRYASLGTFLYNNYVQCLEIIDAQKTIPRSCDLANVDFEAELHDEYNYLVNAHRKQDDDSIYMDYVKALNELDDADFVGKDIADVRRRRTNAQKRLEVKLDNIESLEARLGIEVRWGATHPERLKYQERLAHWRFFKAAEEVEKLVVMRLLELTKLQMSNLGYKLRTHISKALKTRATAIRNAIDRYNKYAAELKPPRQPLRWEQIVDYAFLGEFELLRGEDIGSKRWAHAPFRQAANLYFDAERAKEELMRCNVEIARLRTKICNDSLEYPKVIRDLQNKDPLLARQVERRWRYLASVNVGIMARIQQIETLDGYTGAKVPGTALADDGLLDDRVNEEESALADFFSTLHIADT